MLAPSQSLFYSVHRFKDIIFEIILSSCFGNIRDNENYGGGSGGGYSNDDEDATASNNNNDASDKHMRL